MTPRRTPADRYRGRISGLDELDPRRVALPHGTEVTTTAARPVPGRTRPIPAGAVGRVVSTQADRVVVKILGWGDVDIPREDVVVRRDGQLRFAVRRARDEAALCPCTVLTATVGSRAWGLSDHASDHDTRGVFVWPLPWVAGLCPPPQVVVSADGSHTRWELGRTIDQALRADPNTLEMLFVDEIEVTDPIGQALLDARDAFVSTEIYGSFGRYALSQAKKLEHSLRLAEHRQTVVSWLAAEPELSLDDAARRLAESIGESRDGGEVLRAKQYIKQLYGSLFDQGVLQARSFDGLRAFARGDGHDAVLEDLPRELRPKNAYNLLRIVSCAIHWLRTGEPLIRPTDELRARLLQIKGGEVDLRTALRWTEQAASDLDDARAGSVLPAKPDVPRADALLRQSRIEIARRYFEGPAPPWGPSGPAPPGPEDEDDA